MYPKLVSLNLRLKDFLGPVTRVKKKKKKKKYPERGAVVVVSDGEVCAVRAHLGGRERVLY